MTKHRRITGFVAIVLLAAAATVASMRSQSPSTAHSVASAGMTSSRELTASVNRSPNGNFSDRSPVDSTNR